MTTTTEHDEDEARKFLAAQDAQIGAIDKALAENALDNVREMPGTQHTRERTPDGKPIFQPATKAEVLGQQVERHVLEQGRFSPIQKRVFIATGIVVWGAAAYMGLSLLLHHGEAPVAPDAPAVVQQQPVQGEPFPGYQESPFAKEIGK